MRMAKEDAKGNQQWRISTGRGHKFQNSEKPLKITVTINFIQPVK